MPILISFSRSGSGCWRCLACRVQGWTLKGAMRHMIQDHGVEKYRTGRAFITVTVKEMERIKAAILGKAGCAS